MQTGGFLRILLCLILVFALQACAVQGPVPSDEVAAAFETSGILPLKPYTRTIFSSSNF